MSVDRDILRAFERGLELRWDHGDLTDQQYNDGIALLLRLDADEYPIGDTEAPPMPTGDDPRSGDPVPHAGHRAPGRFSRTEAIILTIVTLVGIGLILAAAWA